MRGMSERGARGLDYRPERRGDSLARFVKKAEVFLPFVNENTDSLIILLAGQSINLYAELYGPGGPGAGGGYNTGGGPGGGGACTTFTGFVTGPCVIGVSIGQPVPGGIYGQNPQIMVAGTTKLFLTDASGAETLLADARGGNGGTVNNVSGGQGGLASLPNGQTSSTSLSGAVQAAQVTGTVVSYSGGFGPNAGGAQGGQPGGPQGSGNGAANPGTGNRSQGYGRGGQGDPTGSGSGTAGGSGTSGFAYMRGD